ncbi:MAG: 50S ribosomal protein L6 [Nitrospirota bacterium]|nr:50S ribosomal protein L6 [Nitrospirota bacterium]
MSRIGLLPVKVPSGVTVNVAAGRVSVKGPKGQMDRVVEAFTRLEMEGDAVHVRREGESREARARHGLMRADLANMVTGVSQGFERKLVLTGVGYRAAVKGKGISMSLGFSHPVEVPAPQGIEFAVDGTTTVIVRGIDKTKVGQTAANIRRLRPPEPYKGKGIAYSDEKIRRKEGKSGKK